MYFGTKFLESKKIDDVVGAIPVHMFAGIFGTLIVPISNPDTTFGTQLLEFFQCVCLVLCFLILSLKFLKQLLVLE
jgi:Amt family ammonium transporter